MGVLCTVPVAQEITWNGHREERIFCKKNFMEKDGKMIFYITKVFPCIIYTAVIYTVMILIVHLLVIIKDNKICTVHVLK